MKKVYLSTLLLALAFSSSAQKTEFSVYANTGLSNFRGESTSKETGIIGYASAADYNYTLDPYGGKHALSVGGGLQVQRVTAAKVIVGVQAGAELLRSKSSITQVYYGLSPVSSAPLTQAFAEGKSILSNTLLNLQPYLGRRWQTAAFDVDLTLGLDAGYALRVAEKGTATTDSGSRFETERELQSGTTTLDIRPRAGIAIYKKHLGASASYAMGIINYYSGYDGGNFEAYQNAFRLGLHYRL